RAAVHARRIEAVMARGRDRLLEGRVGRPAVEETDRAPGLTLVEAVEVVARGDARLAAGARVEVDLEGVLLPRARRARRQEVAIEPLLEGTLRVGVALGEALDRRERLLLSQILVEQGQAAHAFLARRRRGQTGERVGARLHALTWSAGRFEIVSARFRCAANARGNPSRGTVARPG